MSWSGVKKQINRVEIEAWCEEMSIQNYTINSKGEIDVDGFVDLGGSDLKELPYKFGRVKGYFYLEGCKNLTSLENCPNYISRSFSCNECPKINSLEGCPKEVGFNFYCGDCKRRFTKEEVMSLCKVIDNIYI